MKRTLLALTAVALVAAAPAGAQVDFSRYVALGDSLTAGFASGGLVQTHQVNSYPAHLGRQGGTPDFQQPLVSEDGIPPLLELLSLQGPVIGVPPDAMQGQPVNAQLPRPYNNLGVPGATLFDMLFTTGDIQNLLAGNTDNVMHDLILRFPQAQAPDGSIIDASAIVQAISLDPTFVTMWIGNNDVLSAAIAATPIEGVTMTPVDVFEALYQQAVGALVQQTDADIVLINLPDVTAIPFVNTLDPFIEVAGVGRIPLLGPNGPLPADHLVTLAASSLLAQGIGLPPPVGTGQPLPDDLTIDPGTGAVTPGVILRPDEVATISARVAAFNDVIDATADAFGLPVLDINRIFNDIADGDLWILGGIEISADFLLGGIFSYDGVHPQSIGYALVATELIDRVNRFYGAAIPQPDITSIVCGSPNCAGGGPPDVIPASLKNATFTEELTRRLLEVFPPRLPEAMQQDAPASVD